MLRPRLLSGQFLIFLSPVAIGIEVLHLALEELLIGMAIVIDVVAVCVLDPIPVKLLIDPVPLPGVCHPTVHHGVAEDP